MTLDISALEKAVGRLEQRLHRHQQDTTDEQVRDGLIQRFEYTYELAHKTLKRYLQSGSPVPEQFTALPFQDLIRMGNQYGLLLGDWPAWRTWRDMRSQTSHTCDEAKAQAVAAGVPGFLAEVHFPRDELRQRLA